MKELRVLLCCGAGFSSGLLAQQSRKYAKKNGIPMTVDARSESQVAGYFENIDILLLGPHYANEVESFRGMAAPYHVLVDVIPQSIYGQIDGKALVEFAQKLAESGQDSLSEEQ